MDNLAFAFLCRGAFCLAYKHLLADTDDLVGAVFIEENHVVEVRAVADELVFLQAGADETLLAVDVEFLVGFHDLRCLDAVEASYLREARMVFAVFLLNEPEPVRRHLNHIGQVTVNLCYLLLHAGDGFVSFILVELRDALHLDFQQA